jgi:hypothetical protein
MAPAARSVPGLSFDCACFVIHLPRLAPRLASFKVCCVWEEGRIVFLDVKLFFVRNSLPQAKRTPLPPSLPSQAAAEKAGLTQYEVIEAIDAKVRERAIPPTRHHALTLVFRHVFFSVSLSLSVCN